MIPKTFYAAVFEFEATKNDELSFDVGDFVRVTRKTPGGWWFGHLVYPKDDVLVSGTRRRREVSKRAGWFPTNHVVEWKLELDLANKPALDPVLLAELQEMGNDEDDIDADETALDEGAIARKDMVASLLEMQTSFVHALQSFLDDFVVPLAQQDWLDPKEHNLLFGHCQDMHTSHETIRAGVEACVGDHYDEVGEAFAMAMDEIRKPYVTLARNHNLAVNAAMEFSTHPRMQQFLSQTASPVQPPILHIVAWQTRPVQHLDQLAVQLQTLVNATPDWHPAHFSTSSALNLVTTLLNSTRRIMKKEEDLARLRALTPLIEGWDGPGLEEWGDYIMHTVDAHVLSSAPPPPNATPEHLQWFLDPSRQLYLLSKVLIVLRNPVRGSRMMQLVERIPCVRGVLEVRPDEADPRRFFVDYLGPDMQSKRAMTVIVASLEKRNEWLSNVNKLLQANVRLTLPVIPKELQNQMVGPARTTTVSDALSSPPSTLTPPVIQQPPTSPKLEKKGLERLNTLARKLGLSKAAKPAKPDSRPPSLPSPTEQAPMINSENPTIPTTPPIVANLVKRQSSLLRVAPPSPNQTTLRPVSGSLPLVHQMDETGEVTTFPQRISSMRSSMVSMSPTKLEGDWSDGRHDSVVPESPLSLHYDDLIDELYSYPSWAATSLDEIGPGEEPEEVFELDALVDALLQRHEALSAEVKKLKEDTIAFRSPF